MYLFLRFRVSWYPLALLFRNLLLALTPLWGNDARLALTFVVVLVVTFFLQARR